MRQSPGNPFDKQRVLDACKVTRFLMDVNRDANEDWLYQKYRYYRRFYFFGERRERTREQALAEADSWGDYNSDLPEGFYGADKREKLTSIQDMAGAVLGNVVWLTRDEFDLIARYYTSEGKPTA